MCVLRMKGGMLTLCLLLVAGGLLSCGGNEQLKTIPSELTGTWITSESKYAGCHLEISPGSLRFHGVDGAENDFYLLGAELVESERTGGFDLEVGVKQPAGTHYIFHCRDTRNEKWDFHLIHTPGSRESLKFKNRSETWHRG